MNWEMIGWLAIAASGALIVAGFFVKRGAPDNPHPVHVWLETAWPVFFIAILGMLALKEITSFAAVLLLATLVTGVAWLFDAKVLRKKRAADAPPSPFFEMARSFFPVILIIFLLRSFLYEPFKIPSGSMVPTLLVGDYILVNKFTYGLRIPVLNKKIAEIDQPKRGEVMVFRHPLTPQTDLIKRIVGLPGDVVAYRDKRLTLNGQPIAMEAAGLYTEIDEQLGMRQFDKYHERLGEKPHQLVLDPRYPTLNLASVRAFPQRANCQYTLDSFSCTVPPGHYFMMGDSRDNSDDSRYWGFVPDENIVGRAVMVWMNFGALKRIGSAIE